MLEYFCLFMSSISYTYIFKKLKKKDSSNLEFYHRTSTGIFSIDDSNFLLLNFKKIFIFEKVAIKKKNRSSPYSTHPYKKFWMFKVLKYRN